MSIVAKRYSFERLPEAVQARWTAHSQALLDSYRARVGKELIARSRKPQDEAERLFAAPFVVVSHGAEVDPILNYGNAAALALWEMSPEELIATPSRLTAEAEVREAREHVLAETARNGFVSGYTGVRVSRTGRRFRIQDVTVWNVTDADARLLGQTATFAHWEWLDGEARPL
ncbi:MAG TPA: MEKHLA domain-containing protein [Methylocystis sp.]|nr:MEKHLA domain-containing protein [Methylocystis sp.]